MARHPSQSQIRSQIRQAQRQAESKAKTALRNWERDTQRDLRAAGQKFERDMTSELARQQRRSRARQRPVTFTVTERRTLDQVRVNVEEDENRRQAERERDAFLCHAWADREGAAATLYEELVNAGVDAWWSEREVELGTSLTRSLDRGLRTSRIGLVLVTPALLDTLRNGGLADQELSALLRTERVVPIVHGVTYRELEAESPLLASRAGLHTDDKTSLADVAEKVAAGVLFSG